MFARVATVDGTYVNFIMLNRISLNLVSISKAIQENQLFLISLIMINNMIDYKGHILPWTIIIIKIIQVQKVILIKDLYLRIYSKLEVLVLI